MDTLLSIVVVEDHDVLREVTVYGLRELGHTVTGVSCAEAIDDEIGALPVDLLVVDLNLPGEDGISLTRRIRSTQPNVGIIMVTARAHIDDKQAGYASGADIYLTKPTSIIELGAAVQALGRRVRQVSSEQQFSINTAAMTLNGSNGSVDLSAHEAAFLSALARAPGRRLDYWQLMVLGGHTEAGLTKRTLEVQVVRLRKKLIEAGATTQPIKSVRNVGYQLCIPVTIT